MTTKPNTWPFMAAKPEAEGGAGTAPVQSPKSEPTPSSTPGTDQNQPGFIKPSQTPVTPTDDQIMAD